jgi:hypothetical protein
MASSHSHGDFSALVSCVDAEGDLAFMKERDVVDSVHVKVEQEVLESGGTVGLLGFALQSHMDEHATSTSVSDDVTCAHDAALASAVAQEARFLDDSVLNRLSAEQQPSCSASAQRNQEHALQCWVNHIVVFREAVREYFVEYRQRFTERAIALYLMKPSPEDAASAWWIEFVFIDVVSAEGGATQGRIVNLDGNGRIIYALPNTRMHIGDTISGVVAQPLIKHVGATMVRAPAESRQPMPAWVLTIRASLCTVLDTSVWCAADLDGRSVGTSTESERRRQLTAAFLSGGEFEQRGCNICKKVLSLADGKAALRCPICLLDWHQRCQADIAVDVGEGMASNT